MRLPDFLVIGAMKSGTTTLYHDLMANPAVFLADKELNALVQHDSPEDYARHYRTARAHQLCGDVSTCYSMLPLYPQAVSNAQRWLPNSLKIVYVVREPIGRLISHHRHMSDWHGTGRMARDIDACVRNEPNLLAFSRYAFQLRPWLEAYSRDAVTVVRFEDYVANRWREVARLSKFLNVPPCTDRIQADAVFNRSEKKPINTEFWSGSISSSAYRRLVRPLLTISVRNWLRVALLPQAPPAPSPPSADTIAMLVDKLAPEVEALRQLLGHPQPLWNLEDMWACYHD
ncbi:MAG: sulfotransferase domain-containing protein [Pirellulales bacterium]